MHNQFHINKLSLLQDSMLSPSYILPNMKTSNSATHIEGLVLQPRSTSCKFGIDMKQCIYCELSLHHA